MRTIANLQEMKAAIGEMCAEFHGLPEATVFDSKLVACELIVNALRHGGGRAYFAYAREEQTIRISVRGETDFRPPAKSTCSGTNAESGRGLYLVDALSVRREYSAQDGICVVILIRN